MLGSIVCIILGITNSLYSERRSITGVSLLNFPVCLIKYFQTCLMTMYPGGLIHGVPNILSLSIASNWENAYYLHSSQYGRLFNLDLLLLPVSGNIGDIPTFYVYCEIVSRVG